MSYQVHITSTAEHDIMRAADYIEFTTLCSFKDFTLGILFSISATFTIFFSSFNVNIMTTFLPFGSGWSFPSFMKFLHRHKELQHKRSRTHPFFLNGSPRLLCNACICVQIKFARLPGLFSCYVHLLIYSRFALCETWNNRPQHRKDNALQIPGIRFRSSLLPPLCHVIKISIYNYFCKKEFNLYITKR